MKLLFLAPSRLSRGDAIVAADLARALPRAGFTAGFAAAPEAVPQLLDLGLPTLPLTGSAPAENLVIVDQIVRGFKPDCLVAADAFAVRQAGLPVPLLRERYGRPVASFDRVGWQAAGYAADFYGGEVVRFPAVLDDCDLVIRTGPPHSPEVATAGLALDGLRDNGHRPLGDAEAEPRADDRPSVFLVNSPWEYRNPVRSLPVAQLIDALPRLIHAHLAALGRPLRVVHVGPRQWRFPVADQIEYRHFSRLPYPMFRDRLAASDLFVTGNVLSVSLAQAVLAGVPSLVLGSHRTLGPDELPGWACAAAPLLRCAYPFRVAPLGWHDLVGPLLAGNPYAGCFAACDVLDQPAVHGALASLLGPGRAELAERQRAYREALTGLPPAAEAFEALTAAVTR